MGVLYEQMQRINWPDHEAFAGMGDREIADALYEGAPAGISKQQFLNDLSNALFRDPYEGSVAKAAEQAQQQYADTLDSSAIGGAPLPHEQTGSPASEGFTRFLIGAGESLNKARARITQGAESIGARDLLGAAAYDPEQQRREQDQSEMVGGFSTGLGRVAPLLATPAVGAGAGTAGMLGQTAMGALTGGLFGGDSVEEGATWGALGALGGNLVGRGLSRLGHGWSNQYNPARKIRFDKQYGTDDDIARAIAAFQKDSGGLVKPSAANPSAFHKAVDGLREWSTFTNAAYKHLFRVNNRIFHETATRATGSSASRTVGPTALNKIDDAIRNSFDDVAAKIPDRIGIDDVLRNDIAGILGNAKTSEFLPSTGKVLTRIKPKDYMQLRSELGKVYRKADNIRDMTTITNLIDRLDDEVQRIAPPRFKLDYAKAREKYKNLLAIEKARDNNDLLNPLAMHAALDQLYTKSFSRMKGTLLPETNTLFNATRALASDRMAPPIPGIGSFPWMTGKVIQATRGGDARSLGNIAAGLAGIMTLPRYSMAAPASTASGVLGSLTGRTLAQ